MGSIYFEESSPDDFRALRDDRVTEGTESSHPSGNPMSHWTKRGFNPGLRGFAGDESDGAVGSSDGDGVGPLAHAPTLPGNVSRVSWLGGVLPFFAS